MRKTYASASWTTAKGASSQRQMRVRRVDITSHFEGETRAAHRFRAVAYPIARKIAASYYPRPTCSSP
jgi:hypothetical protein